MALLPPPKVGNGHVGQWELMKWVWGLRSSGKSGRLRPGAVGTCLVNRSSTVQLRTIRSRKHP